MCDPSSLCKKGLVNGCEGWEWGLTACGQEGSYWGEQNVLKEATARGYRVSFFLR